MIGGALLGFIYVSTRKLSQRRLQLVLISLTVAVFMGLALSHAPLFVVG
jgi:hypothetical protein